MRAELLAGLVAGLAVAMPVGAIGTYLVALAGRERAAVAVAAALGVATTDGGYALLAALGIDGLRQAIGAVSAPLHLLAAVVLLALAIRTIVLAVRRFRQPGAGSPRPGDSRPWQTYAGMIAVTAVNPATVVTFTAVVLARSPPAGQAWSAAAVFALAAFTASGVWQLLLVAGGSLLGRLAAGPRGQLTIAGASALLMVALALATLLG